MRTENDSGTRNTEGYLWRICKCGRQWERWLNYQTGGMHVSWQSGCATPERCCRELFGHGLPSAPQE